MSQFSGGQFAGGQFSGGQFNNSAVGPPPGPSGPCVGVYYADPIDIDLIYGQQNVHKWADLDNDGNLTTIETRICWSLQNAHAQMNDNLLDGPYAIPFTQPYPQQVITTTARMAGLLLYESRGVTDFSEEGVPRHQLFYHKEMVKTFFQRILAGQTRLMGKPLASTIVPGVFE